MGSALTLLVARVIADDHHAAVATNDLAFIADLLDGAVLYKLLQGALDLGGKVYVALTDNGKQIEGIEGGQGGQLIIFGDPNSKRAVRYLKTIEVE